ncbi:MAG: helix-turn-helix domain-containing protein, partial [candidate division Zixibacteria bacterium]|nr:helix-turn-helix domain-containing protein [candidate division Zixibacteria bacterium]
MTFEFVSDDSVESLGKRLMRVRQDKELLLADVANGTKIHEKYLAAIETGDDTLFPDHVFKELFVKAYAEYLGISLDDLLTRLPEAPTPAAEGAK